MRASAEDRPGGGGGETSGSEDWEDLEQATSVLVAVRVRPLTEKEKATIAPLNPLGGLQGYASSVASHSVEKGGMGGGRKTIEVLGENVLVFDPPDPISSPILNNARFNSTGRVKKHKDVRYAFDRVLDEDSTQEQVYEATTRNLISGVLNGFNSTVFAYGATGCGKTHTISGIPEDPGVIFLTMRDLYARIDASRGEDIVEVSLSFLEVYNETIRDLLDPEGPRQTGPGLALREDAKRGVIVTGLTQHHPKTAEEVMRLLVTGNRNRTMSPTEANAVSSRSHAVLQVNIRKRPRTAAISQDWSVATMSIIDLAGSERAAATQNMGERRREGANINRSLLALGNCINALCDPVRAGHIPYRDSKLTRLLKHSLGGNCKTVMIVCVSPAPIHYEETHNTLKYANRAKNIKTRVGRNTVSVNMHVSQYVKIISELRREVGELKRKVKLAGGSVGGSISSMASISSDATSSGKPSRPPSSRSNTSARGGRGGGRAGAGPGAEPRGMSLPALTAEIHRVREVYDRDILPVERKRGEAVARHAHLLLLQAQVQGCMEGLGEAAAKAVTSPPDSYMHGLEGVLTEINSSLARLREEIQGREVALGKGRSAALNVKTTMGSGREGGRGYASLSGEQREAIERAIQAMEAEAQCAHAQATSRAYAAMLEGEMEGGKALQRLSISTLVLLRGPTTKARAEGREDDCQALDEVYMQGIQAYAQITQRIRSITSSSSPDAEVDGEGPGIVGGASRVIRMPPLRGGGGVAAPDDGPSGLARPGLASRLLSRLQANATASENEGDGGLEDRMGPGQRRATFGVPSGSSSMIQPPSISTANLPGSPPAMSPTTMVRIVSSPAKGRRRFSSISTATVAALVRREVQATAAAAAAASPQSSPQVGRYAGVRKASIIAGSSIPTFSPSTAQHPPFVISDRGGALKSSLKDPSMRGRVGGGPGGVVESKVKKTVTLVSPRTMDRNLAAGAKGGSGIPTLSPSTFTGASPTRSGSPSLSLQPPSTGILSPGYSGGGVGLASPPQPSLLHSRRFDSPSRIPSPSSRPPSALSGGMVSPLLPSGVGGTMGLGLTVHGTSNADALSPPGPPPPPSSSLVAEPPGLRGGQQPFRLPLSIDTAAREGGSEPKAGDYPDDIVLPSAPGRDEGAFSAGDGDPGRRGSREGPRAHAASGGLASPPPPSSPALLSPGPIRAGSVRRRSRNLFLPTGASSMLLQRQEENRQARRSVVEGEGDGDNASGGVRSPDVLGINVLAARMQEERVKKASPTTSVGSARRVPILRDHAGDDGKYGTPPPQRVSRQRQLKSMAAAAKEGEAKPRWR